MGEPATIAAPRIIGRYAIYDDIASGGMATVHLGRLVGPVGFSRTVAIKRLHPQFAKDPEFVSMFLDEARLAARIQHPNVVPTLDVVATGGELFLVMEYVRGESLGQLVRSAAEIGERVPARIAASMISGALQGLHAAHEAKAEGGLALGLVHRDVSPQNVLVGIDGTARVLDFGVAKAENKVHATRDGQLKGKIIYMSPEQLEDGEIDRTTDIYAMGLVLFETLTAERMFAGSRDGKAIARIMRNDIRLPSTVVPDLAPFDDVVRKASAMHAADRYATAREMAQAVERAAGGVASPAEVSDWVERVAGGRIDARTRKVAEIESAAQLERTEVQSQLATELARTANDPQIPTDPVSGRALAEGSHPSVSQIAPRARSQASMPDVAPSSQPQLAPASQPVLPAQPLAPRSPWLVRGLVAGGALLVLMLVLGAFLLGRSEERHDPAAASASAVSPVVAPSPAPTVVASPPATTKADPAPVASAAPSATAPPKLPVKAVVAAPVGGGVSCNPAYTLDAKGHKHFKPECL